MGTCSCQCMHTYGQHNDIVNFSTQFIFTVFILLKHVSPQKSQNFPPIENFPLYGMAFQLVLSCCRYTVSFIPVNNTLQINFILFCRRMNGSEVESHTGSPGGSPVSSPVLAMNVGHILSDYIPYFYTLASFPGHMGGEKLSSPTWLGARLPYTHVSFITQVWMVYQ